MSNEKPPDTLGAAVALVLHLCGLSIAQGQQQAMTTLWATERTDSF